MKDAYEIYIDESGLFGDWHTPEENSKPDRERVIGGLLVPAELADKEAHDSEFRNALQEIREEYFPDETRITGIHISELKDEPDKQQEIRLKLGNLFKKMLGVQAIFIYDHTLVKPDTNMPGAQLFRNMLVRLMQAIIFYHPTFSAESTFKCRFAHRRFNYKAYVEMHLAGQGFLKLKDAKNGFTQFTAMTTADLRSIMDSLENSLKFTCKRKAEYDIKPYEQWDNPFMVMADWLCNTLLFILKRNNRPKKIYTELSKIIGPDRVNFFCPASYTLPEELLSQYYQGNKDTFLKGFLLSRRNNAPYADHYLLDKAYESTIHELSTSTTLLSQSQCETLVGIADDFLENRAFDRFGEVQGLFDILSRQTVGTVASGPGNPEWDKIAYNYHDAGLRLANHTGNTDIGVEHYQNVDKIYKRLPDKTVLDIRSYHEFINRSTITDANEFAFSRAITRLKPIEEKEKQVSDLLEGKRNEIYGKICGTIAQNYAFLCDHDMAEKYFQITKENLGAGNFIQMSYRAHFALEQKDQNRYLRLLCTLFRKDFFPDYDILIKECFNKNIYEMAFPFHLILKGMLTFPPEYSKLNIPLKTIHSMNPYDLSFNNHPWQLIFTAIGRLCLSSGEKKNAYRFWDAAMKFSDKNTGITFVMLSYAARAWSALSWLDENSIEKARRVLLPVAETFQKLGRENIAPGIFNPNKVSDEDGKIRAGWFDDVGARFLDKLNDADKSTLESLCNDFINKFTFNYW
jgi:hypothetical protein